MPVSRKFVKLDTVLTVMLMVDVMLIKGLVEKKSVIFVDLLYGNYAKRVTLWSEEIQMLRPQYGSEAKVLEKCFCLYCLTADILWTCDVLVS